jgi:hypothetical protein
MARLQTEATVWKEATLSFSPTVNPWDSVWTGEMEDGSLPMYCITEKWKPEYSPCSLILVADTSLEKKNTLHLHTLHLTYQHLPPWDGTTGHAVFLLAELLHYKHIYDPGHILAARARYTPPRPLILLTEYEKESYMKNSLNPLVKKIFLVPSKTTLSDVFSLCSTFPPSYVAFTRPGIVLDDWRDLWSIEMEKTLLALSPYEIPASGNIEDDDLPSSDIPATWVFRSEDAPLSTMRYTYDSLKERFLVASPSLSLLTWSGSPSAYPRDVFLTPTKLLSLRPHPFKGPLLVANCFQTTTGLVFDSSTLYIGNNEDCRHMDLLPTESYPSGTIVPFLQENPILFTIAKLLLKSQGVYTCPEEYRPLYRRFGLNNTIPASPKLHFASALVYPYDMQIQPEMIDVLRKTVSWSPEIDYTDRPTLICQDASFEEVLRRGWNVRIIDPADPFDRILANLSGAWGLTGTTLLQYCWMLPRGARVFDLSSSPIHAKQAEVAGLRYIPTSHDEFLTTLHDTD